MGWRSCSWQAPPPRRTLEAPANGHLIGPLTLQPQNGWNAEYEDNVYRSADEPISDIVSTLSADSNFRMKLRHLGLTASAGAEWVHFTNLVEERGVNGGTSLKLDFTLNRLAPYAGGSYENTRDRRNSEIDTRPRTKHLNLTLGTALRVSLKTMLDVSMTRTAIAYEATDVEDEVNLSQALNRVTDQYVLTLLQEITPLTHLTLTGEMQRDVFDSSSYKNADEMRLSAGFQSDGLFKGHARVGIRTQKPHDPWIPEFRGLFVSVATGTTLLDRIQLGVTAATDTEPSYRRGVAYYDAYNYGASIVYVMRPSVRLLARANQYYADYRDGLASLSPSVEAFGIERETRFESGVRFGLGQSMSIDFVGSYNERAADVASNRFESLAFRAGVSHAF